jgi:hypothetical protein
MIWIAILALPVLPVLALAWADWVHDARKRFYGGMI